MRLITVLLAISTLAGCASYSTISERRPVYQPLPETTGKPLLFQGRILSAFRHERRQPMEALASYLSVAESAAHQLKANPNDAIARHDYNFAVSRIVAIIRDAKLDPWSQPLRVPAEGGDFVLTHKLDPRPNWNPNLYKFTPANEFDVRGKYVDNRVTRDGIGAPTVAIGKEKKVLANARFQMPRIYYGVTTVVRFNGRTCEIAFEDPLAKETTRFEGHTMPLAANFTVPIAVMLAQTDPKKLEITRMLNPDGYAETARVVMLQPFDPNKTVVLFIHGLMDSQATWTPMIYTLRGDPDFRKNYQVWFYSYPSGYPYPYSAAILRQELDAIEAIFPLRKGIVIVGHSMGGCISRLMITDPGDKLWTTLFKKKPADTPMSDESRKLFSEALLFKHRPEVKRVIFVSAPLKGADLATNPLGRIGSTLIRSPITLLRAGKDALKDAVFQTDDLKLKRIPNSIDTLAPNNRFVKAINTVPLTPGIPYHTIIGDRGRGDSPQSSDGVVPYWSSHMDDAKSELIVPSDHGAHQNTKAIAEVRRILLENAGR